MKRLATIPVVLVALAIGLTSNVAAASSADPVPQTSQVAFHMVSPDLASTNDTRPVCPRLPRGTTVDGTGTQVSVTSETTNQRGVKTIANVTTTSGTAVDNHGNTYLFLYANEFRITNSQAKPDVFSGSMTDLFVLTGSGSARLRNGFAANLTTDANISSVSAWHVHHAFGDPISFKPGPVVQHCDPL